MILKSSSPLLTDLYQLTMLQAYLENGMDDVAVFDFFVRELPENRNFLIAAGLEQVFDYLESINFSGDELDYLSSLGYFGKDFIGYLENFRFNGDVQAMHEGTIFFPHEPILSVAAPLPQAQLVETRIINLLHFQTLIASKTIRSVMAAPDRLLVDFGLRRAHGEEAGLLAARAAYIAGFAGTSTVLAGQLFNIPIYGTMAHSFIQAHDKEEDAFEHFALAMPHNAVLLIDTYDTVKGAEKIVRLAGRLKAKGISIKAVRLDSGDLFSLAIEVRDRFDSAGLNDIKIFASGNIDEYALKKLVMRQAPIDGYGVGTKMVTSADRPYLDCAYKLVEYQGIPRRKRSTNKAIYPGRKQVYRAYDSAGIMSHDTLATADEVMSGKPLLHTFMKNGSRLEESTPLDEIRNRVRSETASLPEQYKKLEPLSVGYEFKISSQLQQCITEVDARTSL